MGDGKIISLWALVLTGISTLQQLPSPSHKPDEVHPCWVRQPLGGCEDFLHTGGVFWLLRLKCLPVLTALIVKWHVAYILCPACSLLVAWELFSVFLLQQRVNLVHVWCRARPEPCTGFLPFFCLLQVSLCGGCEAGWGAELTNSAQRDSSCPATDLHNHTEKCMPCLTREEN